MEIEPEIFRTFLRWSLIQGLWEAWHEPFIEVRAPDLPASEQALQSLLEKERRYNEGWYLEKARRRKGSAVVDFSQQLSLEYQKNDMQKMRVMKIKKPETISE